MIYLYLKVIHLISIISWMVGLLYLPRLFVYHSECHPESIAAEIFTIMEKRLMKIIMLPSMLIVFLSGILMIHLNMSLVLERYFQLKLILLLFMFGFHGYLAKKRKTFEGKKNLSTPNFYRKINEIPTLLMIIIIFLVVVKPNIM